MSIPRNDGGPAFSRAAQYGETASYGLVDEKGMSLRDWLAGQALQGLLQWSGKALGDREDGLELAINSLPKAAYKLADAMLIARK